MAPSRSLDESDACMRKRLVDSLSQSFPGSALQRALHAMDEEGEPLEDPLSSSCFAELRLDKGPVEFEEDDELTSLTWLQDNDLLKNVAGSEELAEDDLKENSDIKPDPTYQLPPHVPYNPQKHIHTKPPYSFSCLIFMAVEDAPQKKLPVKDIYNWILTHFPYFQNAPTGWKNSVRHNLSLNKCFKKVEKERGQTSIGKGSLWCIDPDFRPHLLQALRKTPYHPYHQLQMLATSQSQNSYVASLPGAQRPSPLTPQKINVNTPSPLEIMEVIDILTLEELQKIVSFLYSDEGHEMLALLYVGEELFPFLSRRLAQSKIEDTDIDVANTLVSLKRAAQNARFYQNGARSRSPSPPEFGSERERELLKRKRAMSPVRPRSPVVITCQPSDDHNYSISRLPDQEVPGSSDSSIDEEYDFGNDESEGFSDTSDDESEVDEGPYSYSDDEARSHSPKAKRRKKESSMSPLKKRLVIAEDEDEEMKIAAGADALLNLAGIKTSNVVPLRSISPTNNNNNNNNNDKKVAMSQA